jgi:hypothetical protein
VVVPSVNDREVTRCPGELTSSIDPTEATADDDDPRKLRAHWM